jgi:hypothetical protein
MCVFLTYVAAIWAHFSLNTGTCTGNDASQLNLVMFSTPLYFIAAFVFGRIPRGTATRLTVLCVSPAVFWQATSSTWLAFHLLLLGTPACGLLFGMPFDVDGKEVIYAVLWLLPLLAVPFAFVLRRR